MNNYRTPADLFYSFFSFFMIQELVTRTNERMVDERATLGPKNRDTATFRDITFNEMKAFIACLIVSGCRNDSHLRTKHMFENLFSVSFYRLLFSEKRYAFIMRSLRFDNKAERNGNDRFEYCRVLWDTLMENCKRNWIAGPTVTVDEQLIPFRGRCLFRMYMPNKPAKYGLKIFMVCDSKSQYCLFGIPYLGKGSVDKKELKGGVNQGEYFTMKLLELGNLLHDIGRVVVTDNWFVSRHLAQTLYNIGLFLIGTIRQKPYLPADTVCTNLVNEQECVAFYDHDLNANYVMKRKKGKKTVTILTAVHNKLTYVEGKKTEAHMYYNAAKGGVDGFDKIIALHSVSRKTNRWPMSIFYGMINIAVANAWIIFKGRPHERVCYKQDFMQNIALTMASDWARERYFNTRNLEMHQKESLKKYFDIEDHLHQEVLQAPLPLHVDHGVATLLGSHEGRKKTDIKKRCRFDPSSSKYSGRVCCDDCEKPICDKHSKVLCKQCIERQEKWILSFD